MEQEELRHRKMKTNNRKKMGRPKEGTVQVLVLKNSGIDVGGFGWKSKAGNISVYI